MQTHQRQRWLEVCAQAAMEEDPDHLAELAQEIARLPQESVTAEIRQIHTFGNDRDEWTTIAIDTRPAGGVVKAFQLAYGIANEGGGAEDGLPKSLLSRLIFIRTSEGFLPQIPLAIQKFVFFI